MQLNDQQSDDILVGLDIGTTKICAVAARFINDRDLDILGVGKVDAEGVRKGVISNIDITVKSIMGAIQQCENRCGISINNAYVGISDQHIQGLNMEGVVAVRGGVVEEQDIERVIESARAFHSPDKELIHILRQEYIVDNQDGIKNPIGMSGKRLQAKVHIVLASNTSTTNIIQSCNMAGINVADVVLEPLASGLSVLLPEEREENVILIDIGGGTSDLVIFNRDAIVHTYVLPIAGNHLSNDISFGLRIPKNDAIAIKHSEGIAMTSLVKEGDVFSIRLSDRPERIIEKKVLANIIEERLREIFEILREEISKSSRRDVYGSRVVITGGTSSMVGIQELAEKVLELPVRIGKPLDIFGVKDFVDSPVFSTAVGLIRYGIENQKLTYETINNYHKSRIGIVSGISNFFKRLF